MDIQQQVDLTAYNSMAVSAVAAHFCQATNIEELIQAINYARSNDLRVHVIAGGSNILFVEDITGLVIRWSNQGKALTQDNSNTTTVNISAGENWHRFVLWSLQNGYFGLENLALIPGCVGAAPIQNIGAYGVEQDQFCSAVEVLNLESLTLQTLKGSDCGFAYRDSHFKGKWLNKYLVLSVSYTLSKQPNINLSYNALAEEFIGVAKECISPQQVADAVCKIRQSKLPDSRVIPNAGSFFKNPVVTKAHWGEISKAHPDIPVFPASDPDAVKLSAAWLIEKAGWKGKAYGRVAVHNMQALVLTNPGCATGKEILALAEAIMESVNVQFGITLETEVRLVSN